MIINVLGTDYEIAYREQHEDKGLKDSDGYCDTSVKRIVVDAMNDSEGDLHVKMDLKSHRRKVLRHELIHAFLGESGLHECSWASDEEIVDWIANQFSKLLTAFKQAECLD